MEGWIVTSEWLGELEDRVRDAAEELRRLRDENGDLRSRVEHLEQEAASRPAAEGGDWTRERDEIRERVERLVSELEGLLEG